MARICLGTSGFGYKEWKPSFYPPDLPAKEFLRYYSTKLNSVEIDSTFYRMPSTKVIQDWKNSTPEDFTFAIKASQQITHRERLKLPSDALQYLLTVIAGLESRLGTVLYQLPPFFRCDLLKLEIFLASLPHGVRAAFEFRHESWFTDSVYAALRNYGAALCIHDADDHTTPLQITAPFTYVRLRRTQYPAGIRASWRDRIRAWRQSGTDVFAYIKHEDNPDAPHIALEFAEDLREA